MMAQKAYYEHKVVDSFSDTFKVENPVFVIGSIVNMICLCQ